METKTMNLKQIEQQIGTLSNNSKMPGLSWEIPAEECNVGTKLREIPNSVCSTCYALKGFYKTYAKTIKPAQYKRLEALELGDGWVSLMTTLISKRTKIPYFRWFGSGDLQSVRHLEMIVEVCRNLPDISFWLPTREVRFVVDYQKKHGSLPSNLNVRISGAMVDGPAPTVPGCTSSVVSTSDRSDATNCPARHQNNACGNCRACWKSDVAVVSYHKH